MYSLIYRKLYIYEEKKSAYSEKNPPIIRERVRLNTQETLSIENCIQ